MKGLSDVLRAVDPTKVTSDILPRLAEAFDITELGLVRAQKCFTLLSLLQKEKVTGSLVSTMLEMAGIVLPPEGEAITEQIATSYRERGPDGLAPHIPTLFQLWRARSQIQQGTPGRDFALVTCIHCKKKFLRPIQERE